MVIKTTRWSPDTCGCVIDYTWDDTTDLDTRVHTVSNIVTKCPAHQTLATKEQVYDAVYEKENKRKNGVLSASLDNTPEGLLYELDARGQKLLKHGITYEFNFTGSAPNRILNIKFNGVTLTNQQKTAVQNKVDQLYGSGNVIVSV